MWWRDGKFCCYKKSLKENNIPKEADDNRVAIKVDVTEEKENEDFANDSKKDEE